MAATSGRMQSSHMRRQDRRRSSRHRILPEPGTDSLLFNPAQLDRLLADGTVGSFVFSRDDGFANKFHLHALDRAGVKKFCFCTAVIISGRHNKPDLIACKGALCKGQIELISEHLPGKSLAVYFEAK